MVRIKRNNEEVKLDEFDPWEHLEEQGNYQKIRAPKIKRVKKEREIFPKRRKRK